MKHDFGFLGVAGCTFGIAFELLGTSEKTLTGRRSVGATRWAQCPGTQQPSPTT